METVPEPAQAPPDKPKCLIWSNQHQMWWRANRCGYTPWLEEAGRYGIDEAAEIQTKATVDGKLRHTVMAYGTGEKLAVVDEWAVLAPESATDLLRVWTETPADAGEMEAETDG